jgi:mRNA-degrading endonuclease toxin of MazEF toxin-antitoxin module
MSYHQWQVVLAHLEPFNGSEKGVRYAIVISNDGFNENLPYLTVLPISTTPRSRVYPSEVALPTGLVGGDVEARVMAHQIRTISDKLVSRVVTQVRDVEVQDRILQAIVNHLGFALPTVRGRNPAIAS